MTRSIKTHKTNPANDELQIAVLDEPGAGGASHLYMISGFDTVTNPSSHGEPYVGIDILFQNGPIGEVGVNGITHEVLLAIVADRLASFQAGPYACTENDIALHYVQQAQKVLQERTKRRVERGVEGTHTV